MIARWLWVLLLPVALVVWAPALALDPNLKIAQYGHTAWRIKDGLFQGVPQIVTQTKDGYLWIGTSSNLVRFDGIRFLPMIGRDERPLRNNSIISLLSASDGTLWVGSEAALGRLVGGKLISVAAGRTNQMVEYAGNVWYVRSRISDGGGPLCHVDSGDVRCLGKEQGIPLLTADQIVLDNDGGLWISGVTLIHWKDGASTTYFESEFDKYTDVWSMGGIALGADHSLWASVPSQKPELLLRHYKDGKWRDVTLPQSLATEDRAQLFVDRDDTLWIGTTDRGLFRLVGDRIDSFSTADGLSGDNVLSFFQDAEGNLWVCTNAGLDMFRDLAVVDFTRREGLSANQVKSVLATPDRKLWIGNGARLDWMSTEPPFATGHVDNFHARQVTSLAPAKSGALWVGADDGLLLYANDHFYAPKRADDSPIGLAQILIADSNGEAWKATSRAAGLVHVIDAQHVEVGDSGLPHVRAMATEKKGVIWFATADQLIRQDGEQRRVFDVTDSKITINAMIVDPDHGIWLTTLRGVGFFADGRLRMLDAASGLPCNNVFALVADIHADLWLSMECGIAHLTRDEVKRWIGNPGATVVSRLLDAGDGADPAHSDFSPMATASPDGRLWFANGNILQMIDPSAIKPNDKPLSTHIEALHADRMAFGIAASVRLPPRSRDIEIDYSAPTYAAPHKVAFRYRLAGYETRWQDAGERRQAFYNDLPPGEYLFEVTADRGAGRWNGSVDSMHINITPAFYQTWWFRLAVTLALLTLLVVAYRQRIRRVSMLALGNLKERIDERDRIARELHDTLLQSVQGLILHVHGAAGKLPAGEPVRQQLELTVQQAEAALSEGRDRVHAIRSHSSSAQSLAAALETICAELAPMYAAMFEVRIAGTPRTLRAIVQDEAFWIAREAMINASRHADASRIYVEITYSRRALQLRVVDDGIGIAVADTSSINEGHFGIPGMRERAKKIGARLKINPGKLKGTEICLVVTASVAYNVEH